MALYNSMDSSCKTALLACRANVEQILITPAWPVLALFNYLSLNHKGVIQLKKKEKHDICHGFTKLLNAAAKAKNISLPELNFPVLWSENQIKPNHNGSTSDFIREQGEYEGDTVLFSLCECLDIKLYHGWIKNPEDPIGIGCSQRQLTEYGLQRLESEIGDREQALLFRDGCLNVVRKYRGHLYWLETEEANFPDKEGESVWRNLTLDESEEILFTSSITPIAMEWQLNSKEKLIKDWTATQQKFEDDLCATPSQQKAGNKDKKTKKPKNYPKKNGKVQDHGSTSANKESATAQSTEIPYAGCIADVDEYECAKKPLKLPLEKDKAGEQAQRQHVDATERMPYYVRTRDKGAWGHQYTIIPGPLSSSTNTQHLY